MAKEHGRQVKGGRGIDTAFGDNDQHAWKSSNELPWIKWLKETKHINMVRCTSRKACDREEFFSIEQGIYDPSKNTAIDLAAVKEKNRQGGRPCWSS